MANDVNRLIDMLYERIEDAKSPALKPNMSMVDRDELLDLLDELDRGGIRFALSNVFVHKGMTNEELIRWSHRYHVLHLEQNYANCSYHAKDRSGNTQEVLITNYLPPLSGE